MHNNRVAGNIWDWLSFLSFAIVIGVVTLILYHIFILRYWHESFLNSMFLVQVLKVITFPSNFAVYFDTCEPVYYTLMVTFLSFIYLVFDQSIIKYLIKLFNTAFAFGLILRHYITLSLMVLWGVVFDFLLNETPIGSTVILLLVVLVVCSYFRYKKQNENNVCVKPVVDLYGRSDLVNFLVARILNSFARNYSGDDRSMLLVGDRGAGKSFVVDSIKSAIEGTSLSNGIKVRCIKFEPWDFDDYKSFYASVIDELFSHIETKYLIPHRKVLIQDFLDVYTDNKEKLLGIFGGLKGYSSNHALTKIRNWIDHVGCTVLIFDDLDRCQQSEVRHVLRLIQRLNYHKNIYCIAVTDSASIKMFDRFDRLVEMPVKVSE